MTERGLPSAESPACPFVAFEDERDERADRPDHRHRCYAEPAPAPRAFAHQEAYCLSSAFPVCPTFQEWARREAAQTRAGGAATPAPAAATVSPGSGTGGIGAVAGRAGSADVDTEVGDEWSPARDDRPVEEPPRRNPRRDWAAPPPWAPGAGSGAAGAAGAVGAAGAGGLAGPGGLAGADTPGHGGATPGFLAPRQAEGRGLAGSAADRLARGAGVTEDADVDEEQRGRTSLEHPSSPADPELAGLVGGSGIGADRGSEGLAGIARSSRRPSVSSTRDRDRERERERERAAERAGPGPAWEHQRRLEAYPQIRSRPSMPGMPGLPRLAVLAGALAIAALALFFLPALLGVGGGDDPTATATPSAVPTPTPEPTPIPAPTPQVYVIKEGDTLSKIARSFGLTLDELLAANTETIEDPDRIVVGDEIIIPVPGPDEVSGGASGSPTP